MLNQSIHRMLPVDTITDVVLQQLDLSLSFVSALLQYVQELQQLSLQNLLLADKSLVSLQTLVWCGCTEYNLLSLVWSGDNELHLKSVCSRPVFLRAENLHSNYHL